MTEDSPAPGADNVQLKKSRFWVVRRLIGVIAPLIVLAPAVMIFPMFAYVPEDEAGMIDVAIAYGRY